jgi:hypothetical protein
MNNILLALSAILILAGCETVPSFEIKPNIIATSIPEIGVETTKTIGEILVAKGTRSEIYGVEVSTPMSDGTVTAGLYRETKSTDSYECFEPVTPSGASIKRMSSSECFLAYNKALHSLQRATLNEFGMIFYLGEIPSSSYQFKKFNLENTNSFQKTLIFTGKDKDILRFTYREFADDYARPAFSVDVVYDLSESKIIQYQKLKMEVLNATSSQITYKLISNF